MLFLRQIQNWFQGIQPCHQFSPMELYLISEWQKSGIPASLFINAFQQYIRNHPEKLTPDFNLRQLRYVGQKLMRQTAASQLASREELPVTYDPYDRLMERVAEVGKTTEKDCVRESLKPVWILLKKKQKEAAFQLQNAESDLQRFYQMKGFAQRDWYAILEVLFGQLQTFLSEEESLALKTPTSEQMLKMLAMSPAASDIYRKDLFWKRCADFFDIALLLEPLP